MKRMTAAIGRLALWGALICCLPAWADSRPALVVSYRDNPPDMISYCADRHSGPLRYVIEEAAGRVGYQVKWQRQSLADSLRDLRAGSVAIVPYLFTKTAERSAIGRFSASLGGKSRLVSFMIRKSDSRSITKFADLAGFTIGYRKDSYYFREFHESKALKTVAYAQDVDLGRAFLDGSVDMVVINNRLAAERAFLGLGFNEFKYADLSYPHDAQLYLLYSREPRQQELFDRLDQAIVQMKQEGLMADIYRSFDTMPLR